MHTNEMFYTGREGKGRKKEEEGREEEIGWVEEREKDDMEQRGKGRRQKKWKGWEETSTTSLLEDLSQHPVSLDAVYVLSDDGVLFVSPLFLQPLHHSLVVVPQVCLQGGRDQSMALPHGLVNTITHYQLVMFPDPQQDPHYCTEGLGMSISMPVVILYEIMQVHKEVV